MINDLLEGYFFWEKGRGGRGRGLIETGKCDKSRGKRKHWVMYGERCGLEWRSVLWTQLWAPPASCRLVSKTNC
jgi:hypothetical protein